MPTRVSITALWSQADGYFRTLSPHHPALAGLTDTERASLRLPVELVTVDVALSIAQRLQRGISSAAFISGAHLEAAITAIHGTPVAFTRTRVGDIPRSALAYVGASQPLGPDVLAHMARVRSGWRPPEAA